MKYSYFLFFVFTVFSGVCFGQNAKLLGKVKSTEGDLIPGAYIKLTDSKATITDETGNFNFNSVEAGEYVISVLFTGYQIYRKTLQIEPDQKINLNIVLTEEVKELEEITISTPTETTELVESTASVSIIEAKAYYNRSINVQDLLNTASGVQVRQSGGVGNSAEVSIQGLSGKQVKFFIDGIPMDFLIPVEELGLGASLAMLPVNLIERIEVYKGTVPVSLGADALGGAINIITRKDFKDYIEFSAEHSSFNTWKSTLSLQKQLSSEVILGIGAFYTASDNSYQVDDVKVVNDFGNPETFSATKFHDRFRSYLLKADIGIINKPWADKLAFSFSYGDLYDEIQHNFEMRQPYGKALNLSTIYNTAINYEKYDISERLDVKVYLGYNSIQTNFIDTTRDIYNWRGEIIGTKTYGGEITTSQNNLTYNRNNLTGKINLNYKLSANTQLTFNSLLSQFTRTGSDPVAQEYYQEDYFKEPVYVTKLVSGLGLEHLFFNEKIKSLTAVKLYNYLSKGFVIENDEVTHTKLDHFQLGASQSFKWEFNQLLNIKASYEYATRMPDRIETLGDFSEAINANPALTPETSHNVNLGILFKKDKWNVEANSFFREVNNIIILQAVPPPVLSKYENLLKARIVGVESDVQFRPWNWLTIKANATYQDLRNRSNKENAGVSSNRYFGVRLPNKPYFFGNASVHYLKEDFINSGNLLQAWWSSSYVEEFYRYWEIDGREEDKLTIPDQNLHHVGMSYTCYKEQLTVSLESQNIFNTSAYDNFRVQKPGRSWHVKLKLFFD